MSLLLHSLATFDEIVFGMLDVVAAKRVVEVGAEGGDFSAALADWADRADARVVAVDPEPSDRLRLLARERDSVQLVEALSPGVLGELEPQDVYFLDGDHNYATVSSELVALRDRLLDAERPALAVLHDVAWPSARRDSYYAPERIPADARQPYTYEGGVAPGNDGIVAHGGFRGGGVMAFAEREGGERNGVLTAVEDFIARVDGLTFRRVPAVFGVGFLYSASAPWAEQVDRHLTPYDENALLDALERNRIDLFVRVLELQDELERERLRHARIVKHLQTETARLRRLTAEG